MESLRATLGKASERSRLIKLVHPLADDFLADLDEVVQGRGDGVVAVKRGRLEGVSDIVVFNFDHSAAVGRSPQAVDQRVLDEVLRRLPVEGTP